MEYIPDIILMGSKFSTCKFPQQITGRMWHSLASGLFIFTSPSLPRPEYLWCWTWDACSLCYESCPCTCVIKPPWAVGVLMETTPTTGLAKDRNRPSKYQLNASQLNFLLAGSPKFPISSIKEGMTQGKSGVQTKNNLNYLQVKYLTFAEKKEGGCKSRCSVDTLWGSSQNLGRSVQR